MKLLAALILTCCAGLGQAADYVRLPGGPFESVLPQGPVATLSAPVAVEPFAMRTTPVTVAEFVAFTSRHPEWKRGRAPGVFADKRYLINWSTPNEPGPRAPADSPVTNVSWFAAKAFCEEEGGRLPTWLEWEYAAAADATRHDARSDPAWRRQILAWYEKPTPAALPPVGGPPNAHGVRNMHGLVWEWVDDFNALFIAGDSRTQGDPDVLKFCGSGALNIIDRDSYAVLMRIALLSSVQASDTTGMLGFRCVRPDNG